MTIKELLDKQKNLIDAADEIHKRVYNDQNGEWRGDDTKNFDDLLVKAASAKAEADRMAALDAAQKGLEDTEKPQGRRSDPVPPGQSRTQQRGKPSIEDRALAFHGWMATGMPRGRDLVTTRHQEAAARCNVDLGSGEFTIRLAPQALSVHGGLVSGRNLRSEDIREWEQRLTQVSVVSPDLGGHFTVPDEMMRQLEVALLEFGDMRRVATVTRTASGAAWPIPTLNDTTNKGAIIAEGVDLGEQDVEFNQLVLDAYKYSSKRVPVSWEYLQDNAINFTGRIGAILGERIARAQNEHFTTGDGSSKPRGIMDAATSSGVTTTNATTITYDNLIDLKHSVDPAYRRRGAMFMFDDTTLKLIKKIKVPQFSGDTNGQPLWRAGLTAGEPDTIDGDTYVINQDVASGSNARAIAYGDLSKYQVRDVQEVTLLRLNERYAELGVVVFVAWARADGDLLDAGTNPVKYLTMGA